MQTLNDSLENIRQQARDAATEDLAMAERRFLMAHGWSPAAGEDDSWSPPSGYYSDSRQSQTFRTGHAVNSQKNANGTRRKRSPAADQ